ncbi:MAG: DUF6339 family protein [Trueperaceae bacterium]|nr:DUF6339 family protein [Trueperaceae bacterium]
MRYPTLSLGDAKRVLETWRAGDPREAETTWRGPANDEAFDVESIEDVIDELHELRRRWGEPKGAEQGYWTRFEGSAAAIVHATLDVPPDVASDPEFWAWLVLGSGHDGPARLVTWRHVRGDAEFGTRDENYGVTTDLEKGLFSRIWLRAQLAFDPDAPDPYALARRGSQDLWRSHLLRTEYGQVPHVARALLTFVHPDDDPERPHVPTDVVRAMAKALRRRHASSAFELLDADGARALIRDVHAEVTSP